MLWMFALSHDDLDEGFDVWANLCGLATDAFWRPILTETVMCWHVITVGGMLAVSRGSGV